jgi:hypothetical protein
MGAMARALCGSARASDGGEMKEADMCRALLNAISAAARERDEVEVDADRRMRRSG